jgi:hypothetical protein
MKLRTAAALLGLAVLGAACADEPAGPDGGNGGIDHPTGASDLVLRVDVGGGFVPLEHHLRTLPTFALYGDGSLYAQGAQIAIYPAPALPALVVTGISEEGMQAILEAAEGAGLLGPDRHYDYPLIADAATTTFTVVAEGERHVVSAYALFEGGGQAVGGDERGVSEQEASARAKLAAFLQRLSDLRSWLPAGAVGEERVAEVEALRVFAQPYAASPEPGLAQAERPWPLDEPLDAFGSPFEGNEDLRCAVVEGQALDRLLPAVAESNELTPWVSAGERWHLIVRPLLPDESGC